MVKDEQKAVLIALVTGTIAGALSKFSGPSIGLLLGVVVAFALNRAQKLVFKEKAAGWPQGNLIIPYILTWIVTWIILFNV